MSTTVSGFCTQFFFRVSLSHTHTHTHTLTLLIDPPPPTKILQQQQQQYFRYCNDLLGYGSGPRRPAARRCTT